MRGATKREHEAYRLYGECLSEGSNKEYGVCGQALNKSWKYRLYIGIFMKQKSWFRRNIKDIAIDFSIILFAGGIILAAGVLFWVSTDEIPSIYLNESPYGGTVYGVEEASQSFFGKSAADVTLAEAAYLASLPQLQTFYSPYGNNKASLDERKNLVLQRMLVKGFITEEEYNEAKDATVEFQPQALTGIRAPHFVMFIREYLAEKYGEEALAEKGLKVITTLDWELQKEAERILFERGAANVDKFKADNAGMIATDPKTGDLLVMVGSRDYFSEEIDGNFNVTLAERQPGSSIKPFIYATAFSKGFLPDTVVFDVRTQFSPACPADSFSSESPCYSPNNYNNKFLGPI